MTVTARVCSQCGRIGQTSKGKCSDCLRTYEREKSRARNHGTAGYYRRVTTGAKWKKARGIALARAGNRCAFASSECRGRLSVHHRVKIRDGGAPYAPANLVVVCRRHHEQLERVEAA